MSNRDLKYYFFNDNISVNNFDLYNTNIDEKSRKDILIYYIAIWGKSKTISTNPSITSQSQ